MKVDDLGVNHPAGRCWLSQKVDDSRHPLRRRSSGPSHNGMFDITFGNLTEKEFLAFESFETGASYLRVIDGRLHAYHSWSPLPAPEEDPILAPHWKAGEIKQFGGIPSDEGWHSPGIIITGLGAGAASREERDYSQRILTECGFACMRSQRGADGTYWEQWVLHFMEAATGPLKTHLDDWKTAVGKPTAWHAIAEEAAHFITRDLHVAYGSLDITIQRWALSYD